MDAIVNTPTLEEIATRIEEASCKLDARMSVSAIALGELFLLARDGFTVHGNHRAGWYEWIEANTRWKPCHAINFIVIHEKFGRSDPGKTMLALGPTLLRRLASPSNPPDVLNEVTTRLESGEKVSRDDINYIIKSYKSGSKPKPKKIVARPKRGKEKFIRSTQLVCQLAQTAFDLPIPMLDQKQVQSIIAELEEARRHIGKIIQQLREDVK